LWASSGAAHQRRVEVDVGGFLLCAGCAAGELVLIRGQSAIGDSPLDLGL
jgi:hypothetical protein